MDENALPIVIIRIGIVVAIVVFIWFKFQLGSRIKYAWKNSRQRLKILVRLFSANPTGVIELLPEANRRTQQQTVMALGDLVKGQGVPVLLELIKGEDAYLRKEAAMVLAKLYRGRKLDQTQKQQIFKAVSALKSAHTDQPANHRDTPAKRIQHRDGYRTVCIVSGGTESKHQDIKAHSSLHGDSGNKRHTDEGVKVDFPL